MVNYGIIYKTRRVQLGLSTVTVAKAIGKSIDRYRRIEREWAMPFRRGVHEKICEALLLDPVTLKPIDKEDDL